MQDAAYTAYRAVRDREFPAAVALYDALLVAQEARPDLWVNRGVALQAMGRLEEALESYQTSLRLDPDNVGGHVNCGVVLGWVSRNEEALWHYNRALAAEPDNVSALLGRSVILATAGDFDGALQDSRVVLESDPGHGGAHYNRALVLLSLGEYREGFMEHEWRFGTRSVLGLHRFPHPVWLGEDTTKKILVVCEQGLGDQVQFARYLLLMKARGLDVIVEAPPATARLLEQLGFPVYERGSALPTFGLQSPIMSGATMFNTALEDVPFREGYLSPSAEDVARGRYLRALPGLKVGLCWYSGVRPDQQIAVAMHRRKTVPTADLKPLLGTPGVSWVSLQKDDPGDKPAGLEDPMGGAHDLAATAGIIANLDLVISVDSVVAHLAAAMGKPVWVLNRADICWRWRAYVSAAASIKETGEINSPWYTSAKVYCQSRPRVWGDVLEQVRRDLEEEVQCNVSSRSCSPELTMAP